MPRASALRGCSHWNSCYSFRLSHLNCHLDLDSVPQWSKHPTVPNQRASVDTGQRVRWIGKKKEKLQKYRHSKIGPNTTLTADNFFAWLSLWISCLRFLAACHVVSQTWIELEYSDIILKITGVVSILRSLPHNKGFFLFRQKNTLWQAPSVIVHLSVSVHVSLSQFLISLLEKHFRC